jgi:hypothetical protein
MTTRAVFAAVVLWQASLFGQAAPSAPPPKPFRMEIRPLEVKGPKPPEPKPADWFEIDRAAGLVRFRSECVDGRIRTFETTLSSLIEPQAVSEAALLADGSVQYRYQISNSSGARQDIIMFAMGMEKPELVRTANAPELWKPGSVSPRAWKMLPTYNWYVKDSMMWSLAPGKSAGPFALVSSDLPGLTDAYFRSSHYMEYPPQFYLVSPWISKKFHELLENEYYVRIVVVGPKIRPAEKREELLAAIRKELQSAAEAAEFASLRDDLLAFSAKIGTAGAGMVTLPQGKTPLQREFLSAMAINLAVLNSRRQ